LVGRRNEDAGYGGERRDAVATEVDPTYAEETLARAIVVLGDAHAPDDDREDAARVIQAILVRACPSEAVLADLLSALGRALNVHLAIRRVLGEVQRLRPDAMVERAGRGVERLMAQAYQDDHHALAELLLVAFEHELWARLLRDEWGKAATRWAVNGLPERKYPAALLISGWLHAFSKVPSWMRELAEEHPHLAASNVLPQATRWQLHTMSPSVGAWHHLAGTRGVPPTVEASSFGDRLAIAVETLEQAHGEAADVTKRSILLRWLHELTGAMP